MKKLTEDRTQRTEAMTELANFLILDNAFYSNFILLKKLDTNF
jgi:hypothetical protein